MSNMVANSLFIVPSAVELYQDLIKGMSEFGQLGNRLIQAAETAHAFRQYDRLKEIGLILSNFPAKDYQVIGQYYIGLSLSKNGFTDINMAQRIFEMVASVGPQQYKSKSLLMLSAIYTIRRDLVSAFKSYSETAKTGESLAIIQALRGMAVLKSYEGYHKSALKDLEDLHPMIRHAPPQVYFGYLNSLAVELGEVGRKYEARNVIKHVIASPFALAYPEWQDTANELKEPNRSFISVPEIKRQPVERKQVETPKPVIKPKQPASVLSFPKLKEAPLPEKPERLTPQQYVGLSSEDRREIIFAALKTGAIREDDYYKMMVMLGLLKGGPADEILDLESDEVLADIACVWSAHIGGEVLVGFLSALRDCDDRLRQSDIIERLIRKIFHETQICGITEEEWRLRVERRLPKN